MAAGHRDGESLRRALLAAAAARPLVGGESPDQVEAAALRIAELLGAVLRPEREALLREAVQKVSAAESSLRKLEKKVRQAALATVSRERIAEASALAPEIRIEDLQGTVRFSLRAERQVEVAGGRHRVEVVARLVGGTLERSLLARPVADFVAEARAALREQLAQGRAESEAAARRIDELIAARVSRPLYDARSLGLLVERALREAPELPGSGKTWHALNELVQHGSGVHLAPLRLLALEGQEEIEKRGRRASFITGEERDIREGATFIASTARPTARSRGRGDRRDPAAQ